MQPKMVSQWKLIELYKSERWLNHTIFIHAGNLEEVKMLIKNGADVNSVENGKNPLHFASKFGKKVYFLMRSS